MSGSVPPPPAAPPLGIPGTGRIIGFTGWNLFGMCAPMVVALISIPLFIQGLGTERFGALIIIWMLVGYFGLLDFGMGKALTKITAEKMGLGEHHLIPRIFWTALMLMGSFGLAGALILAGSSNGLATHWLNIPEALQSETRLAFLIVSLGLPFTVVVTGLIGMLETQQRFRLINLIRIPLGMATYLAPLAVIPFTANLAAVVAVLIAVRMAEFIIFMIACLHILPALRQQRRVDRAMMYPLLTFGGWMTASNIALPLMIHIDRFIIGTVRSLTEVTYYANPAEIAVKVLIVPRAWVSALFPPLTMHLARGSHEADTLFARAVKGLVLVLYLPVLVLITIAPEFLGLWLGPEFATESGLILQLLTGGIFIYSLSYLAFSLLQSAGRPDLSARWHLIELPLFVAAAWWVTREYGILGMAIIWGLRGLLDVLILYPLALRYVPEARTSLARTGGFTCVLIILLPVVAWPEAFAMRMATAAGISLLFILISWFGLVDAGERQWLIRRLRSRA
jgi:O-antigen/teichoic acid export membrane protein